ncbi:HEAT repeat domain-containing protein [Pendulispora albinea]|uniref:HEAT repeat domain-containing protein n=1 Tax=Pendulispora albinea TaxID=2741071 RepID=A0ABZ2LUR0_9BACT
MKSPSELKTAIQSPGFTPSLRDAVGLLALLSDPDVLVRSAVEKSLARLGEALVPIACAQWENAPTPARVHLVRAVGRITQTDEAVALFLRALEDASSQVRRSAARALGKVRGDAAPKAEHALVAAWKKGDLSPEEQRAFASALGTLGAESALELLAPLAKGAESDPELARIAGRARLMIERTHVREAGGSLDPTLAPPSPIPIVFHVRRGLEPVLQDELEAAGDWGPLTAGEGWVRGTLRGPLERAFVARTALSFALRIEKPSGKVADLLTSEDARSIFTTWTRGPIRYRLAFAEGGHRRAQVWQIAREVSERWPELINDPTASLWEVRVYEARDSAGSLRLELCPRGLDDPRFSYRVRDVPAASHPTIAAALVRVAGIRDGDVVWDPFVGSGMELIERARLGPCEALFGTDLASKALEAARANLDSARVSATLSLADATRFAPPKPVTLIVTNPPMGLRVARTKELGTMLEQFLEHAAEVLAPGGRLTWLTPFPDRTRRAIRALPLDVQLAREVDMGGFWATLEVLQKQKPASRRIVHR